MTFNMYVVLVFMFVTLILYLEIRGYLKQRKVFIHLQNLMHEWGQTHHLTNEQWEYLARGIKVTSNPFSIVKLTLIMPFVPFIRISRSPVGAELQQKDAELYKKTIHEFNNALSYASPTLYVILLLETQIILMCWRILLAVVFIPIVLIIFLTSFTRQKPNIKYNRKIDKKYNSAIQADFL